jgi:hypothetical protein
MRKKEEARRQGKDINKSTVLEEIEETRKEKEKLAEEKLNKMLDARL